MFAPGTKGERVGADACRLRGQPRSLAFFDRLSSVGAPRGAHQRSAFRCQCFVEHRSRHSGRTVLWDGGIVLDVTAAARPMSERRSMQRRVRGRPVDGIAKQRLACLQCAADTLAGCHQHTAPTSRPFQPSWPRRTKRRMCPSCGTQVSRSLPPRRRQAA